MLDNTMRMEADKELAFVIFMELMDVAHCDSFYGGKDFLKGVLETLKQKYYTYDRITDALFAGAILTWMEIIRIGLEFDYSGQEYIVNIYTQDGDEFWGHGKCIAEAVENAFKSLEQLTLGLEPSESEFSIG